MHRTLDDSIQALVGHLPAVAPVVEVEEKAEAPGVIPETLETLRQGTAGGDRQVAGCAGTAETDDALRILGGGCFIKQAQSLGGQACA